jgi:hypothetical protein
MNWVACCAVGLFFGASIVELALGNHTKAIFYVLSSAINLNVMFMK